MSGEQQSGRFNHRNLMMIVCMLAPLFVLGYFFAGRLSSSTPVNGVWLMLLICPLMHLLMMRGMLKGQGNHGNCSNTEKRADNRDRESKACDL